MRVAAIQFAPAFRAKKANLASMTSLAMEAAKGGAKLVVFPELATTGYSYMSAMEAGGDAESIPEGPTCKYMRALGLKLGVDLVWGMVEIDPGTGKLHNSQVYQGVDGAFAKYQKVNLWGNDFLWAKAGISNPPILDTRFNLKVGLLICRDIRDKKDDSWSSFYGKREADLIAFSSNWGDGGFPAVSWMDFVADNEIPLVVSNRYGKESNNNFGEGGICIIGRDGSVNTQGLVWSQDCMVYGDFLVYYEGL